MSSSSSDSQLALVRAEIKSFERAFAARHGRDPTVQDIRDEPSIAEKYKLYKRLSKTAPATNRLPAPKSPPAEPVPLPRSNPFSPTKKSVQHNHANLFATPASPSPDSSPSVSLSRPNVGVSSPGHTFALSRARKRLRGEPVSPSPNKPKRQRIRPQVSPHLDRDSSNSENEADRQLPKCDFAPSFVTDSPAKAPVGGKSFKLLFDDAIPALSIAKKPVIPSVPQLASDPDARFPQRASSSYSVSTSLKPHCDLQSKGVVSRPGRRINRIQPKLSAYIFPTKDPLPTPSHKPTLESIAQLSQPRASMKRTLDDSDPVSLQSQHSLIPPSPPPQDSINRDTGKGKAKTVTGRKKSRLEDEEHDLGSDSPDDVTLKVATVSLDRCEHRQADALEWDPLLHLGTRNHDPEDQIDANHHASGTFTVDLPDRFRRVLAISPPRSQNSTEERVVRGLLYGDRVGHYDPSRGGDIWSAGEIDEGALGDAETEDDWEGEPVPWEVGEL